MPPPPRSVVVSIRDEDVREASPEARAVFRNIIATVRDTGALPPVAAEVGESALLPRALPVGERGSMDVFLHTHYLCDAPVHGQESNLPPVIIHDLEFRL